MKSRHTNSKARAARGPSSQALYDQAQALQRSGRLDEARRRYGEFLRRNPRHFGALRRLAALCGQIGDLAEAAALMSRAVEIEPAVAAAHCDLGAVLLRQGRAGDALASLDRAIALGPENSDAHVNRGCALYDLGRHHEALASLDRAIALSPEDADAHNNRGNTLRELNRAEDALASFDRAIVLAPGQAAVHGNRGGALCDLGRHREALASFERAIALDPGVARPHNERGVALYDLRRPQEAIVSFDRAIALQPDYAEARFGRALAQLSIGELREGFEGYRWRWRLPSLQSSLPDLPFALWEGESLAGKAILVRCEQGFGDSLHFIRYVKPLAAMAARVVVIAPPALVDLFRSIPGVEFAAAYDGAAFDYHIPLLCLPRLLGATLETIPSDVPYLAAEAGEVERWAERFSGLDGRLKVGLVWAGDSRKHKPAANAIDRRRSLRLEQLAPLAGVAGVQFVSLQKGEPAGEARRPPPGMDLIDVTAELDDFADTAALIEGLDLVITVDTSVAHLAGALAKPVWILSRFDGSWRWLNGREDSPWYPTARLFHQKTPGDWDEVVGRVAGDLDRLARAGPDRAAPPGQHGVALYELGRHREALASLDRAIALSPDDADAHEYRGLALRRLNRAEDAVASFDRAIALKPDQAAFHVNRGCALYDLGRHHDALASFDAATALSPDDADAHENRGLALRRLNRAEDAVASFDRAIALRPDKASVHSNRGNALRELSRADEALASHDRAIALNPRAAEAYNNRGVALFAFGRPAEAIASCEAAIALKPDFALAHFGRAVALMATGDLAQGFEAYRWRWRLPSFQNAMPDPSIPPWEGESLAGKSILVHCEQGFGDSLHFIRYVKFLAAMAARVVVIAPAPLIGLFRSIAGVEFAAAHDGAAYDYRVALMCLPRLFGTTLETIPNVVPYLTPDAGKVEQWARRLSDSAARLKVGLVWAGDSRKHNPDANAIDRRRSLALEQLAPLAGAAGVRFVSLQKGEPAAAARRPPAGMDLLDPAAELHDFSDTAALIEALDLVVTVDTSVAHLAGALGKPVWILSRYDGCWRWLNGREDNPWYPTARLFHQHAPGAWDEVVERVAAELAEIARNVGDSVPNSTRPPSPTGRNVELSTLSPKLRPSLQAICDDGLALHRSGKLAEARERYVEVLRRDPGHFDALYRLAILGGQIGDMAEAAALLSRAARIRPADAAAHCDLAAALLRLGRAEDALASADRAVALDAGIAVAHFNRGAALTHLRRDEDALAGFDRAIGLNPALAQAHNGRGLALMALKRPAEALASFDRAIALRPQYGDAHNHRGKALRELDRPREALDSFERAIALDPGSAEAHNNRGVALHEFRRLAEALASCDAAIARKPDYAAAHFNRAGVLLSMGDLRQGFDAYRWRLRLPSFQEAAPHLPFPLWEGEDLAGKAILVHCEQGFGDSLHFIRYAGLLADLAARVVVIAPAPLIGLFKSIPGVEFAPAYDGSAFDCHVALLCLPRLFGTTLETIPAEVPYLTPDAAKVEHWAGRLVGCAGRRKVGLVWAGDARGHDPDANAVDRRRSLRLEQLAPLARAAGVQFVSLQKGEPGDEAREPPAGMALLDLTAELADFADTAALIANLDLVITVDTSVAHLAGALGKPVWILSRYDGCWRWLNGREDSPWYPTARLFHQRAPGDWAEVVGRVASELAAHDTLSPKLAPKLAEEHLKRGVALGRRNRHQDALASFDAAIERDPGLTIAHHHRGVALGLLGRQAESLASLERALGLDPDLPEAHFNRGRALKALGRPDEAVESFDRAIALRPDLAHAHNNRGSALRELNRAEDALASFDAAIALTPLDALVHNNRGCALHELGSYDDAVASFDAAITLNPQYADAHRNRGHALRELNRADEALASYDRVIGLDPGAAEAHSDRGVTLLESRRPAEALASFDAAVALRPDFADAHFHRSLALLAMGDLPAGFESYRWRWRMASFPNAPPTLQCPEWEGESLAGKSILVHCEQGLGDSLHFIRYVKPLAAIAARVVVMAQASLVRLFGSISGVEVVAAYEGAAFDYRVPLLDLPRLFGATLATIPADVPYLAAEAGKVAYWAERLRGCDAPLKVGLVWAGAVRERVPEANAVDRRRSIRLEQLSPLAKVAGVQFFSLQKGEPAAQARQPPPGMNLIDPTADLHDFSDTAALIEGLDLVITVDTSVAHLAGALGKPVWILSRYDGCWRWLNGREDSPWYPTARLFHQSAPGDWDEVVWRVADALAGLAKAGPEPGREAAAASLQAICDEGLALHRSGQLAEARRRYEEVLRRDPGYVDALHRLAILLGQTSAAGEAVALLHRAIDIDPAFAAAHGALASMLGQLNRHQDALASYDRTIALNPDLAEAHFGRGVALLALGRDDDALASFDATIGLNPHYADAHGNRGVALGKLGRHDDALASYDRAVALRPDYVEAHHNRGVTLYDLRRPTEAIASYQRAIARRPDFAEAHYGLARARLAAGELRAGFESYRWRWRTPAFEAMKPSLPMPPWEGESLAGKTILVHCEQGFGDSLHFIRYVQPLAAVAARVVVIAPAPLVGLFRSIAGVDFLTAYDGSAFDYHVPLLCLPRLFGTTLESIPAGVPYLMPEPAKVENWTARLAGLGAGLKVGLVWAGALRRRDLSLHAVDLRRSLNLAQLAPLARVAGVRFVSLQKGEPGAEASRPPQGLDLIDPTAELHDFADTAALIANLDLVITVDTAAAHLAGALAKPVWILSRYDGCWRWLNGREDSPWYPTARLFHQCAPGDWDEVVERVATELARLAHNFGDSVPNSTAQSFGEGVPVELGTLSPKLAEHHFRQGAALGQAGRHQDALASFDRAIALNPDVAQAHFNRGLALCALDRREAALASFDRAIALSPQGAIIHCHRGRVLRELGRHHDAVAAFDAAIALDPDLAEAHNGRGGALSQLSRHDDALASYDAAIALSPASPAPRHNRGVALYDARRPAEAIASYDAAIALQPDYAQAHFSRSTALLALGDLRRGFEAFRWRWRLPSFEGAVPGAPFPPWEGEPLAGKAILVHCEQGFGDSLQFIRYAPQLAAMAARVTVIVQPPLVSLFASAMPDMAFAAAYDGSAFDYRVALMCLPRIFGTTLETIPADVPYLFAAPAKVTRWAERLAGCEALLKVGLVWAGDSRKHQPDANAIDRRRSLTLEQLAPLAGLAGVQFVSLQKGEPAEQARRPPAGMDLIDLTADLADFAETAALIANLDLVITVDTSVAHLAGAMGKPVWILSRFDGCWRWLNGREDSPWYPTARLFHQKRPGEWDDVIERVAAALGQRT